MRRYSNLSGKSGVIGFEILPRAIKVWFQGGECYLYDEAAPGLDHVKQMKALAIQGAGLSTYISQHVRERFAAKC